MTPEQRDALIARAKKVAVPVASCVAARLRPSHLLPGLSRDELEALVLVLAEAVDPVRLRLVVAAGEDGPVVTDRAVTLRKAHSEVNRLRGEGLPVPLRLGLLEGEYQEQVRAARSRRAGDGEQQRDEAA